MLTAKAPGADVDLFSLAIDYERGFLNVRRPLPFGVTIRVADVMPELDAFPTNITLHDYSFDWVITLL